MHSSTLTVLFAGAVAAQSTVTVLNLVQGQKSLTLKGSDNTATTYENVCPSGAGISLPATSGSPSAPVTTSAPASSSVAEPSDIDMVPLTALPTGRAAIRRRQDDTDDSRFCEPYTLIQGSETWQFHLTDPSPGIWTMDASCSWKGEIKTADITCTAVQEGSFPQEASGAGTSTVTFKPSEVAELEALQVVTVVNATPGPSGGSQGNSTGPVPTSGGPTPTGTPAESTGLAASVPIPTGAMVFAGGAAGILAAAMAL